MYNKSMSRYKYKIVNDKRILVLIDDFISQDIPLLQKLLTRADDVEILGTITDNVDFFLSNRHDFFKYSPNFNYSKYTNIPDSTSTNFLTKIYKMQLLLIKYTKMTVPQLEAFKNYFIDSFKEISTGSLRLITLMSSVLGIGIMSEGYAQLEYVGAESFTMHFFVAFIFREMVPIMNSILIASKCVTAITAKISIQKINSEWKMLNLMNIHDNIILSPKWLAFLLATPLMNLYAIFFAFTLGIVIYSILANCTLLFSFNYAINFCNMTNFMISQVKSLVFGWWMGLVTCSAGVLYDFGNENLGKAIVKSVTYTIGGIVFLDMLMMYICTRLGI
ncbi:MAG: ABC transporter permease [Alphaproteobacteria bacterium]|nr:MAG: ABC transporter permease [Alphaproteobacteria bacterium]